MPRGRSSRTIIATLSAREQRLILSARQRLAAITRFAKARAAGIASPAAVQLAGASGPSLSRWKKAFTQDGLEGLLPGYARCGRKSELVKLRVAKWVLCRVEAIALQEGCGLPAAWKAFARSADCPPAIAARIRKGTPPSFIHATGFRTVKIRLGRNLPARHSLAAAVAENK